MIEHLLLLSHILVAKVMCVPNKVKPDGDIVVIDQIVLVGLVYGFKF